MSCLKAAVLQTNSGVLPEDNLRAVYGELELLVKNESPAFVLLPENVFSFGFSKEDMIRSAETYGNGELQDTVASWAREFNCWLAIGSIYLKFSAEKVSKSLLVFDNLGNCIVRYNKIHLFDVTLKNNETHFESEAIFPGDRLETVSSPIGELGLSICYDLRFPELYRGLKKKGAEVLLVPAAFTAFTGKAHWLTLLRARAIENQCFVLAANQWGQHVNNRKTYGHSVIISPWGEILAIKEEGVGHGVATIDLNLIKEAEGQIPCVNHMKGYQFYE